MNMTYTNFNLSELTIKASIAKRTAPITDELYSVYDAFLDSEYEKATELAHYSLINIIQPKYRPDNRYNDSTLSNSTYLVSLGNLVNSIVQSDALMQQYELNSKIVDSVYESLFVHQSALVQRPRIAILTTEEDDKTIEKMYCVGGRHRVYAITQFVVHSAISYLQVAGKEFQEKNIQELVNFILDSALICVHVEPVSDTKEIMEIIFHDNGTRKMSAQEIIHIKAQAEYGLSPKRTDAKSVNQVLNMAQLSKAERKALLNRYFLGVVNQDAVLRNTFKEATWTKAGNTIALYVIGNTDVAMVAATYKSLFLHYAKLICEAAEASEETNKARHINEYIDVALATVNQEVLQGQYLKPVSKKAKVKSINNEEVKEEEEGSVTEA